MEKPRKKKKFRIQDFLKGIGKPLGGVLNIVGDLTGIEALEKVGKALKGPEGNVLSAEEKAEAIKLVKEDKKEYYKDLENARQMQLAIATSAHSTKLSKNFIYYLAGFIIVSATLFGVGLYFIKVPEENKRLVEMFADIYLFGGAIMVLNFFFGSSQGSKEKTTKMMKDLNDIGS